MVKPADLSPEARTAMEHFMVHDEPLFDRLDELLDGIEDGTVVGKLYDNHARFVTFRLPGRDDLYSVIWEDQESRYYVHHVGRVRL